MKHISMQPSETHPFSPFLPKGARILMLGTFPPASHRWSMPFYYPNFQNDMWRIMGVVFFSDKNHFLLEDTKRFDQKRIEHFLTQEGIAMYDTAFRIVRTRNTASDKDLQVLEEADIESLLRKLPLCNTVIAAGQLATTILCRRLSAAEPKVGRYTEVLFEGRLLRIFRMPSSSRAYPLSLERKAEEYAKALLCR